MIYKKLPLEEKVRVVQMILSGMGLKRVMSRTGLAKTTILQWVASEDINPDKEYARSYAGKRPWLSYKARKKGPKDPFPEGVSMASRNDPEELERENRDLRKKVSYLEDKAAYLETLYRMVNAAPGGIPKKKDSQPSANSSEKGGET